jgi:hypothetical protein
VVHDEELRLLEEPGHPLRSQPDKPAVPVRGGRDSADGVARGRERRVRPRACPADAQDQFRPTRGDTEGQEAEPLDAQGRLRSSGASG